MSRVEGDFVIGQAGGEQGIRQALRLGSVRGQGEQVNIRADIPIDRAKEP
ncbi:hypothetical protein KBY66_03110 [Synechococcus sp. Tobar12-5m-g]|nr:MULTISPECIES: hypothetical protein [unclassified Synechococcus]MCP9771621.1 hypothetical protein [Synechococcus sp. Tobar12-5m-g]MCP9872562.1 hypothetical protein [Synechococcus sp. Cruz CV-v-12]